MSEPCSQCGTHNPDRAQICGSCGAPIEGGDVDRLVGTVLLESYRVTRVLGTGGMAVVYLGENQLTGQAVAIKMLPPELAVYPEIKTRFLQEARTLALLEHPNIVHLINFAEDGGRLCLVMQYAEGENMEELMERRGRLEPSEAVRIAIQVLDGLEHAHKNQVVHRDIKPSNIIVRPDGSVKVTDFGIAKITRDNKLTQTGQTMGTVRYMAPEQVRGKGIDTRTDLYALGVTLYEAVVGEPPFDGDSHFEVMQMHLDATPESPRAAGAPISGALETAILRALSKPQEDRFQSAVELRAALKATPEYQSVRTRSTEELAAVSVAPTAAVSQVVPTEAAPRASSPSRGLRLALSLGVLVLLGAGVTLWFLSRGESGARAPGSTTVKAKAAPDAGRALAGARMLPARHVVIDVLGQRQGQWPVAKLFEETPPIFVYADRDLDADVIAQGYRKAVARYGQLLRDQAIAHELEVRPLTLVLLADALLNDKRIWERVPEKEEGPDFYVPGKDDSVLFVVNDKPYSGRQIRYSVALHFCPLKVSNDRCMELARSFEKDSRLNILP